MPNVGDALRLSVSGKNTLGRVLGTGGLSPAASLDDAIELIDYAGDKWDNTKAVEIITDAVQSDAGRFYTDRTGSVTFKNRHELQQDAPSSADQMKSHAVEMIGAYDFIDTAARVTWSGRETGAADSE